MDNDICMELRDVSRRVESGISGCCLDAANEIERLRAELAEWQALHVEQSTQILDLTNELVEERKPICNVCVNFHFCWARMWDNLAWVQEHCPSGKLFERVDPVRLYEKEGKC